MKATKKNLIGRKIVDVDFRPFNDGRGGKAHDPVLTLDNGRRVYMATDETDVGCYGVHLLVSSLPPKKGESQMKAQLWLDGVSTTIEADSIEAARERAEAWVREATWDTDSGSVYVTVVIRDVDKGEEGEDAYGEHYLVTIDPPEPKCTEAEHDWESPIDIVGGIRENPGVWGHGGGVIMHAVCMHCGCERVTDTWAQDRETGQQGLESIRYYPRKYAEEVAALTPEASND